MSVMQFALALFSALAAIPKILGYLQDFAAGVTLWWVSRQNSDTIAMIADAAAMAARAQTKEERLNAAEKWRAALSRPRHSN